MGKSKIKNDWHILKLSDLATKVTDGSHNPPKKVENGYPMYSGRNLVNGKLDFSNPSRFVDELGFQKENKRTNVQAGDIFLSVVGSIGLTAIVPEKFEPFLIQRSIALIRTKQNSEFIRYYFESPRFQNYLKKEARGAAQKGVYLKTLRETEIPLPPLLEQRAIVAKLDALFERIDTAIALIKENIAHTEALMGSVLDEEFGNESNELISLEELVEKTKNRNPKKDNIPFQYIDISSVDKEKHKLTTTKLTLAKDAPSRAKKEVFKGDIIFATTRPNLKNIARITLDDDNLIASTGFCVLRPKENKLDNDYLFYFLISDVVQSQIAPFTKGAQYPAISDKVVKALLIPNKDYNKQISISKRLKNSLERIEDVKSKHSDTLSYLEGLKQSLLDVAFKGELA